MHNIYKMVAFTRRLGLRETDLRFFPRKRVPGPNNFLFSLSEEITLYLILYTVNMDQSIAELKIITENESIASSRKT